MSYIFLIQKKKKKVNMHISIDIHCTDFTKECISYQKKIA